MDGLRYHQTLQDSRLLQQLVYTVLIFKFNLYCDQKHLIAIRKSNKFLQENRHSQQRNESNTDVWDGPSNDNLLTGRNFDEAQ